MRSTIDAMLGSFSVEETVCHLGWISLCGRIWCVRRDDAEWWSDLLNYIRSIAFSASAIASFTLTTTGQALATKVVNAGTFLGAVCFLVGAYVLLPQRRPGRGAAATAG